MNTFENGVEVNVNMWRVCDLSGCLSVGLCTVWLALKERSKSVCRSLLRNSWWWGWMGTTVTVISRCCALTPWYYGVVGAQVWQHISKWIWLDLQRFLTLDWSPDDVFDWSCDILYLLLCSIEIHCLLMSLRSGASFLKQISFRLFQEH